MIGIHSRMRWYPPAETHIPLTIFRQSTLSSTVEAEKALCEIVNVAHCLLGPSGRSLLYQLLCALAKNDPDRNEVLIPAYTCYSVAAAVVKAQLKIRLYDLEPITFAPDPALLSKSLGAKTLAVITQHLLGVPTNVDMIGQMARDAGAWHIEDAAQALGGSLNGIPLGATGDFGLLSFGRGKPLPLGGGGALLSRRFDPAKLLPRISIGTGRKALLGSLLTQPAAHPLLYGLAEALPLGLGQTVFDPSFAPGRTPLAVMKLIKPMMATLPDINRHRRSIAFIYEKAIPPEHRVTLPNKATPVFPRYPVLGRAGRMGISLRQMGVRRLYPNALHQEPEIAGHIADAAQKRSGAETLARQLITLPTHQAINEKVAVEIARNVTHWINQT